MSTKTARKVGQLSIDELRDLIGQVVEEKLEKLLPDYVVNEEGLRISARPDEEDSLPLKPEFEKGLKRAIREAKGGRVKSLKTIRSRRGLQG